MTTTLDLDRGPAPGTSRGVTLNPPHYVRAGLYVLTLVGTPVALYLNAKGVIGDIELTLWGAEVTAVNAMAALNAGSQPDV